MKKARAKTRRHVVPRRTLPAAFPLALALAACATWTLYLAYTAALGVPLGFPLDDSWIHQTFARNLARTGMLAYNPGEPSTGSTSPLWTVFLAVGYLLPVDFRVWAYGLGLLFLALSAALVHGLARQLFPGRPTLHTVAALATLSEWHLAWAALSGMETTLFILLSLLLVHLGLRGAPSISLGLAGGLLVLTRPEGVVLLGLTLAWRFLSDVGLPDPRWQTIPRTIGSSALALAVAALVVTPSVAYNVAVGGSPLPATYYAKYAAYAVDVGPISVVRYVVRAAAELGSGPLLLLYPGLGYLLYQLVRSHRHQSELAPAPSAAADSPTGSFVVPPLVLPIVWIGTFLVLYAIRLPVVFHHGRYLMPLIPWLVLLGLGGLDALLRALPLRLLARAYVVVAVAFWLAMWGNGAVVYGWDTRFIDDEQVTVARWLRANTPPDTLVASHDVGAIGYFADRRLIDTAGLITAELADHVRDQTYIRAYLERAGVDYLAIFPAWYPGLAADPAWEAVFRVEQPYAVAQGAENMIILHRRLR